MPIFFSASLDSMVGLGFALVKVLTVEWTLVLVQCGAGYAEYFKPSTLVGIEFDRSKFLIDCHEQQQIIETGFSE